MKKEPKPKQRKGNRGKGKWKDPFEDFKEEVQWREGKENVYSVN